MRRAYLKSVLSSLLISSTLFVAPLSTYADHTGEHTIEQLKVQITALLAQVVALQQQLGSSSSGRSSTLSSCPRLVFNFYLGAADNTTDGQVSQLQRILAADAEVYPEARITGYYGPLTEQAVRRFQKKHGIVSSGSPQTTGYGVVGPATRIKLLQRCQSVSSPSPITDWKSYRNSEYGFEFKYPSRISPITYTNQQPCFVDSYFSDASIIDEANNTYKTAPTDGISYLSLCIVNPLSLTKGSGTSITLRDFPEARYSVSAASSFKETKVGNLNALELTGDPQYKNILLIQLPSGIIVEFTNSKSLDVINLISEIKNSFHLI